jgi:hypothetical protein
MKFQEKRLISRETAVSSRSLVGLSAAIICLVYFDVSLEDFRPMGLKTSSENWHIIAIFAVGFLFINHIFKFYNDYVRFKGNKLSSESELVSLRGEKFKLDAEKRDLTAEKISFQNARMKISNAKIASTNFEITIPAPDKDNEKLDQLRIEAMELGEEAMELGEEAMERGHELIERGIEAMERGHEYRVGLFEEFLVITPVEKIYFFGWYLYVPSGCAIWAAYLLLKAFWLSL